MAGAVEVRDRLAQRRQAERQRVVRVSVAQRADAGLDDGFGGREIRLADLHVHDVAAGGSGGLRAAHDFHDVERGNVRHAGGGAKAVGHAVAGLAEGTAAV